MAFWLPLMGFLVGGGGVLLWGMSLALFFAPPLPPGHVYCGTCALAGWFVMLFVAPLAALATAVLGWIIGLFVGDIRAERDRANREAAAAPRFTEGKLYQLAATLRQRDEMEVR
ncbi:MAG TPA: hypothetical protein PLN21_14840 [Gemmatales bacterium]|nr:hypothetical protein [Gemmatales bacterium]